jgi:FixJ family two-component response regulator
MADTLSDGRRTVFVVDDDSSLCDSLSSLFRSIGLQIQTFASTAEFLQNRLPDDWPSCLVLDIRLPGVSGLDFQAELSKSDNQIPIIFMIGHGDIPMSVRAMKAGATEFLAKPFRDQDMLDAVQLALERDRQRREMVGAAAGVKSRFLSLTTREREIMELVTEGLLNKQIAAKIELSEITVKVHRGNVMRKMGARSVADLVRMADLLGLHRQAP